VGGCGGGGVETTLATPELRVGGRQNITLLESAKDSPACPSGKRSLK
jgi:hypothetical protein